VSSANTTHGSGWNTPNGSWWIVQAQHTSEGRVTASRIPPTAVGGLFKPSLKREPPASLVFVLSIPSPGEGTEGEGNGNPGVLPRRPDLNDPPTAVGGIQRGRRAASLCRPDLNDPPTAVGGIQRGRRAASLCRPHLNDPPTAVGGIQRSRRAACRVRRASTIRPRQWLVFGKQSPDLTV
jgi:hypothetical protein